MARRKGLTPEDLEVWAAYSRTLQRLMPGRSRFQAPPPVVAPAEPPEPLAALAAPTPAPQATRHQPPAELGINASPAGLDKSTWRKFTAQKMRVEARLDLHGHTASRAHHEVRQFLELAIATRLRCVEIITGNGEILARELPHWLNAPQLRPMILGLAHPHARNTGSVRVLLRRGRGG